MEQAIIQKKLFFTIVGLNIFFLIVWYALYTFRKPSYRLHVCVDSDIATIIRESPDNHFDVYSANSTKNILWCLGKHVPFFERTLQSLHVKNQTTYDELALRYQINATHSISPHDNELINHGDHIRVMQEEGDIMVYFRPFASPYIAIKQARSDKLITIISPRASTETRAVLEKKMKLMEVDNGSRLTHHLSRRLRQ